MLLSVQYNVLLKSHTICPPDGILDDTDAPAPKRKDTLLSGLILKLFTNVLASITFMLSSYPYFT